MLLKINCKLNTLQQYASLLIKTKLTILSVLLHDMSSYMKLKDSLIYSFNNNLNIIQKNETNNKHACFGTE